MITTYTAYNDPGHGWIKVTRTELESLGIADKISNYSYERGEFVYLEEDCDAGIFIEAKRAAGVEITIKDKYSNNSSKIRGYDSYSHRTPEIRLEMETLRTAMLNLPHRRSPSALKQIHNANLRTLRHWKTFYGLA